MATKRETLANALQNMATGTSKAAELKRTAKSHEVRQLAEALHFIGHGAQEVALAFLEPRFDDLPKL